jgi:hypothetical protein
MTNRARALLKAFFPAAIAAFERGGRHRLESASCRTILAAAPTPQAAGALSIRQLATLLRRAGRRRGVDAEAAQLRQLLGSEQIRQPDAIEQAMGLQLRGLLRQLDAICQTLTDLEEQIEATFAAHPDAMIVSSFPGVGVAVGARLLAEIGDDRDRFADARALKAFAGAAPVTRASGKTTFVHARRARTTGSRRPATSGHWPRSATTPTGMPATGPAATPVSDTSRRCGSCSTACSANSTTA